MGSSDYDFHASFPQFTVKASETGGAVLHLIQDILTHVRPEGQFGDLLDDMEESWGYDPESFERIAEGVEDVLEEVDRFFDKSSNNPSNIQVR